MFFRKKLQPKASLDPRMEPNLAYHPNFSLPIKLFTPENKITFQSCLKELIF